MALGCVLDASVGIAIVVAAIWGNSLTLYGESIRGWLLLTLEIVLYFLLRRINRGAMPDYDYGTNKLEQFANFAVGSALILGALWLLAGMVERMGVVQQQSDSGMIFAAAISLLNLAINLGIFITLWRAGCRAPPLSSMGRFWRGWPKPSPRCW